MHRALLVSVALLLLAGAAGAQDDSFIPDQEKQKRIEEIKKLAQELLDARKENGRIDTIARTKKRDEMVQLDAIEKNGRVLGRGFSVPAFKWLYQEGLKNKDVNARLHAIVGLEQVQHATAIDAILDGLTDPSPAIQLRVLGAVESKSIQRAWQNVLPLLESKNRVVMAAAAKALAKLDQDPDKQVSDKILAKLSEAFDKLKGTAETETEERQSLEELIEVLGRAYAGMARAQWPQTQKLEDIEEAINKYKASRNRAFLGGLRDPVPKERLKALSRLRETPEKSVFFPVLEAVVREFQNLQAARAADEKKTSLTFLAEAAPLLNQLSGRSEELTAESDAKTVEKAIQGWQQWYKAQLTVP